MKGLQSLLYNMLCTLIKDRKFGGNFFRSAPLNSKALPNII